jgi:hypothetical protein
MVKAATKATNQWRMLGFEGDGENDNTIDKLLK